MNHKPQITRREPLHVEGDDHYIKLPNGAVFAVCLWDEELPADAKEQYEQAHQRATDLAAAYNAYWGKTALAAYREAVDAESLFDRAVQNGYTPPRGEGVTKEEAIKAERERLRRLVSETFKAAGKEAGW